MDLLALLRAEISSLGLSTKEEIKDYIYIRTGQLFNYDPLWIFGNEDERRTLYHKRIDIHNVTDFNIVCFGWAYMFAELLRSFNIVCKVVDNGEHAYVISYINGETYFSDLMNNYEDITRIKFGINPLFNIKISNRTEPLPEADTHDITNPSNATEHTLLQIKDYLKNLRKRKYMSETAYIKIVYETIINIIATKKDSNIGVISGSTFIRDMISLFTDGEYHPQATYFYDTFNQEYIKVYTVKGTPNAYYVSKMTNGAYEFRKSSNKETDEYIEHYQAINQENLNKPSRKNNYEELKKEMRLPKK